MTEDRKKRFKELLALPETPDSRPREDILEPLADLVEVLRDDGVGAGVVGGSSGRRTLVLWPLYQPGRRSMMLSFVPEGEGWYVHMESGKKSLRTKEDADELLQEFVALPAFKESIANLKEQATWPVEGVLTAEDNSFILPVPPELQRALHEASSEDIRVTMKMEPGEQYPEQFQPSRFESGGLEFDVVVSPRVSGRSVEFAVRRRI